MNLRGEVSWVPALRPLKRHSACILLQYTFLHWVGFDARELELTVPRQSLDELAIPCQPLKNVAMAVFNLSL